MCYLAGNFQRAPTIFFIFSGFFLYDFIKNPQSRNAHTFLPLNISPVGSVAGSCCQERESHVIACRNYETMARSNRLTMGQKSFQTRISQNSN